MSTRFNTLFTLRINHDFYGGVCEDFDFIWSPAARSLINRGRMLTRVADGILHCLYEADSSGVAIKTINDERLVLGLRLSNPYFNNFTNYSYSNSLSLYRNGLSPVAFDAPMDVIPVGRLLTHRISETTRPVDITLNDLNGNSLEVQSLGLNDSVSEVNFNLKAFGEGRYSLAEDFPLTSTSTEYYYDESMLRTGVFAYIEINIDSGFYSAPPDFQINFTARTETLKYYIVADNYTDTEFAQLTVSDTGFTEDSRPQINFNRLASSAFTADDIDPSLLGNTDSRVTVFKSQSIVSRQQSARKRIQLSRNGDVLIANLPAPGVDKAKADFVIHVAKP